MHKRLHFLRHCALAVFVSLFILPFSAVYAEEEFDFDQPPVNLAKPISGFENICGQFITKKLKKKIGQNFKPNGDEFWLQTGQATIDGPVGGPSYINERMNAYEKAVLAAKKKILSSMKLEISREVSYQMLGPEQKEQLKASAPAEDKEAIAQYEDKRDISSAAKKVMEIFHRDLDKELADSEESEPAPKSIDEATDQVEQKLRKVGSRFSDTVNSRAMSQLHGIRRIFVADNSPMDETSKGTICVAVVWSDKTRQIADAMYSADASLLPVVEQPGPPLSQQIPDPNTREGLTALISTMGVDIRVDENGNFWLISYAIAGPEVEGNDLARQEAGLVATERAYAGLRTYMGETAILKSLLDIDSGTDVFGKNDEAYTFNKKFDQEVKSVSEAMILEGATESETFGAKHPVTENEVVGAYVLWSASTLAGAKSNAKGFSAKNRNIPKSNGSKSASNKDKHASSNATSACELDEAHSFETQTVEAKGSSLTESDAILKALKVGVSKVNGLSIAAETQTALSSLTSTLESQSEYLYSKRFQQKIQTATKGVVRCWELVSSKENSSLANQIDVTLLITVTKYKTNASLNLPRIAFPDHFRLPNKNQTEFLRLASEKVPAKIANFISETKKFALIDRQYMDLTNAELNLIKGTDFKLEELARLGNRVGTDYLVVGKINKANQWIEEKIMRTTGKKFETVNSEITLSIRMIDVATSQIIYTDEVSFGGKHTLNTALDYVTKVSGSRITNMVFPGSEKEPLQPVIKKSSVKEVQDFGRKALDKLKEETKNDW